MGVVVFQFPEAELGLMIASDSTVGRQFRETTAHRERVNRQQRRERYDCKE
jgi:hypothetical protein